MEFQTILRGGLSRHRVFSLLLICAFVVFGHEKAIAATNHWSGSGGDSLWSNSANWSLGQVPTSGDTVYVDQSGTYTVTVDTDVSIADLYVGAGSDQQTLSISNHTFTVTSGTVSPNGILDIYGSLALVGDATRPAGTMTVDGVVNFYGTLSETSSWGGTGQLNWKAGYVQQGNMTLTSGLQVQAYGIQIGNYATVINETTINWVNGIGFWADQMFFTGNSVFENRGTFLLGANCAPSGDPATSSFQNFGTIRSIGTNSLTINNTFSNYGILEASTNSKLVVNMGTPSAFVNFHNGTEFDGPGTTELGFNTYSTADGTITVNGTVALSGTMSGTSSWNGLGLLKWQGGMFRQGSMTLASDLQVRAYGIQVGDYGTLINQTTVQWMSSPDFGMIPMYFFGNSIFENRGTFLLEANCTVNGDPSTSRFNNYGTILCTNGSNKLTINNVLNNYGTFEAATNAALVLDGALDHFPIYLWDGTTFNGAGTTELASTGRATADGTITVNGTFILSGTVSGWSPFGSSWNGSGLLRWQGGMFQQGNITLSPGLQVRAYGIQVGDYGMLINQTTVQWMSSPDFGMIPMYFFGNSIFENRGTFLLEANCTVNGDPSTSRFNNYGTILCTNGSSTLTVNNVLDNYGIFEGGTNATLVLNGAYDHFAINLHDGTKFNGNGTTELAGPGRATADGTITVNGTVLFTGSIAGTHTWTGPGAFNVSGGQWQGATATLGPDLHASGNFSLYNAQLSNQSHFTWNGGDWFIFSDSSFNNSGTLLITTNGTVHGDTSVNPALNNTGTVTLTGGEVVILAPSANSGLLDLRRGKLSFNSYTPTSTAQHRFTLAGTVPAIDYAQMQCNDPNGVTLNGALAVQLTNDFIPAGGSFFELVGYSSYTNGFTQFQYPALTNQLEWLPEYTYANLILHVKPSLTVTPDNISRSFGVTNPTLTGTITGIVGNDPITATYSTTADQNSPAGDYPITAILDDGGSGALTQYQIITNTGTLRILSAAPTISGQPLAITNDLFCTANIGIGVNGENTGFAWSRTTFTTNIVKLGTVITMNVTTNVLPLADGPSVAGSTTTNLTISNVTHADEGLYTLTATNAGGSATSVPVFLKILEPLILTQPLPTVSVNLSSHTNLTVMATNSPTTTNKYQWYFRATPTGNFAALAGKTNAVLDFPSALANQAGSYFAVVTNHYGKSTSSVSVVTVVTPPSFITPAVGFTFKPRASVPAGSRVVMVTTTVKGTAPSYQWNFQDNPKGSTTATNIIDAATLDDAGNYSVTVANSAGVATSANLALTVTADTNAPSVSITKPSASSIITNLVNPNGTVIAFGTAADNAKVTNVYYRLSQGPNTNVGPWTPAQTFVPKDAFSIAATWTNTFNAYVGTNVLETYSVDWSGLTSKVSKAVFYFHVPSKLNVSINEHDTRAGEGTDSAWPADYRGTKTSAGMVESPLTFPTNGATLYVNRGAYTLTAIAGHNQLFTNWAMWTTGSTNITYVPVPKLDFVMQANLNLQANFIHNPWMEAQGSYNGLFTNDAVDIRISGFISMKVMTNLSFSGKLLVDGDTVALSGKFNTDGTQLLTLSRATLGKRPLYLAITNLFGSAGDRETNQIVGMLTDSNGLSASVLADQWIYTQTNYPSPGQYTMIVPGAEHTAQAPGGYSFGTMTVDGLGKVLTVGSLAEGTVLSPQVAYVGKSGRWPMFNQIYACKLQVADYTNNSVLHVNPTYLGMYLGWMSPTNSAGTLRWTKLAVAESDLIAKPTGSYTNGYTNGFSFDLSATIKPYVQRGTTNRLIDVTNGLISFVDGNLDAAQTQAVQLKTNNTVGIWGFVKTTAKQTNIVSGKPVITTYTTNVFQMTTIGTNTALGKLAVAFDQKTGKMSGSFTNGISLLPTGAPKPIVFSGAVLQPDNIAYGFFMGTNQSGAVTFEADPTLTNP